MKIKKYYLNLYFVVSLISIFSIDYKINAQEVSIVETEIVTNVNQETSNAADISSDDITNSHNLEIANQETWQLSQHNHHDHDNSDHDHQELNNQETTNQEQLEHPAHDNQIFSLFLIDQLEYRGNNNEDSFNWDAIGWVGGDYQKLWLKTEGEFGLEDGNGEAEVQLLYGKLIAPFWDLQVGVRYDQLYGDDSNGRGFAVIGVQGVTPYFFEIDTALFISNQGDVSARLKAEYELLLTQRLVLQPTLETNVAIQEVEEFGVGSGFNNLELGLRLRYEISRNFAPYMGVNWNRLFGGTADFAKEEGESVDNLTFVGGFRLLF